MGKKKEKEKEEISFMKISWSICLCILSISIYAQQTINIGFKQNIKSKILQEERTFYVSLPEDYEENVQQEYPVVFLLDAEKQFESYVAVQNHLSKNPYPNIPKMIVIGIENIDRTKDLTPSKINGVAHAGRKKMFENSGGNDLFLKFIEAELFPYVKKAFRINDYKLLIGHSFGGLTTINALLKHNFFNAYLAIDPSLWWDDQLLIKKAKKKLQNYKNPHKTSLYFSLAGHDDKKDSSGMASGNFALKSILETNNSTQIRWKQQHFSNYNHGTVVIPSFQDGLLFLFDGYQNQVREVLKNPQLLTANFNALTNKLGYHFKPQLSYLKWMKRFAKKNGNLKASRKFEELIIEMYPKN